MRALKIIIVFGIALNILFGVYYIQLLNNHQSYSHYVGLLEECHQTITSDTIDLKNCDKALVAPYETLKSELKEYQNTVNELKTSKKEMLAFTVFELKASTETETQTLASLIQILKYIMIALNILLGGFIIAALVHYLKDKKVKVEKAPELKKLFLKLVMTNFSPLFSLYTAVIIPDKFKGKLKLDLLANIFFSLLKMSELFTTSLKVLRLEIEERDDKLVIVQKMMFSHGAHAVFYESITKKTEFKMLENIVKKQSGNIQIENDAQNETCYVVMELPQQGLREQ
ncbi:MAG: hypothetical protein JNM93_01770 [Bacteriovoracaceae bacterium]|nr:hypothetical protein [Bacteriovoracaceae bacterium]